MARSVVIVGLLACSGQEPDGVLPTEEGLRVEDTGSSSVILDTGPDTGLNGDPEHFLFLYQTGLWEMSPFGGPYTHVVGEIEAWEYLDEERPRRDSADTAEPDEPGLICETTWALVGTASEELCPACEFAFDIEYTLVAGDDEPCRDPDLPASGDVLRFGWNETDRVIEHDVGGAGLWMPWWAATRAGDDLAFEWSARFGVVPEEDE